MMMKWREKGRPMVNENAILQKTAHEVRDRW